jgi:hypothetical protein
LAPLGKNALENPRVPKGAKWHPWTQLAPFTLLGPGRGGFQNSLVARSSDRHTVVSNRYPLAPMTDTSSTTGTLTRHQARRAGGVPTITALVGPTALGHRLWRAWVGGDRRPCAIAEATEPSAFLAVWVGAAFAAAAPADRAVAWLASATGRAVEAMARDVERMTRYDLDALRGSVPVNPHGAGATAAFLILNDRATGVAIDSARFVRELGDGPLAPDGVARTVLAVAELYPPELWPALLLIPTAGAPEEWGLFAARALERVAVAEPRAPVAVALTAEAYERLTGRHSDARAVALLREGFVEVRGVGGNELEGRLRAAGVEPSPTAVDCLTADGLAEEVADAFVAAARSVRAPTTDDLASDFRSVHESFLFEQLESMPQTAGLFRPNCPMGFRHGTQAAEGDLVAESLKLVVEVDGAFYHLNPDQYRRDRRKDWLYQREGYLVLRFLADDVVGDLELVLNTILEAVALRRASARTTGAA